MIQFTKPPKKKKKPKIYDRNECFNTLYKHGHTRCELHFDRETCKDTIWLDPVHRHKRRWYLGKGDLINDYNQIILGCRVCHDVLEQDPELTKQTFDRLRG